MGMTTKVAGFASPAQGYEEQGIDLNRFLIRNPSATYFFRLAPEVETYSIDESFLFYPGWKNADYTQIADDLKKTVTKETGIPVSIGVAPNKTLAKMCSRLAKKSEGIVTKQGTVSVPGRSSWFPAVSRLLFLS